MSTIALRCISNEAWRRPSSRPTMTHHRVPLLLAAVTLVLLLLQPCSSSVTAEEDMIQWIRAAGGEVNVEVATVDGLRGTAVTEDIPKGGTLALVPQSTMYVASSNKSDSLMRVAVRLMQEMANSSAPGRLYWATMPTKQELRSEFNFPRSYLPLLQMAAGEAYVIDQQEDMESWWSNNKGPLIEQGFALQDLQHALGVLATRSFSTQLGAHTMLPLMDLANHETACPNHMVDRPCPGNRDSQCMHWLAGRDYKKGDVACNTYGGMFNDRSLVQYGFVMEQPQPPHLYGVDRHDFDPVNMWGNQMFDKVLPEPFKSGTSTGYREEVDRLKNILNKLQAYDTAAAKTQLDERDPSGHILAVVLRWRQLRQAALEAEISRMNSMLEVLRDVAADAGEL